MFEMAVGKLLFLLNIVYLYILSFHSFLKKILFIFRQRERKGERGGEKHQCVVASHTPPIGDLAPNPGM